MGLGVSKDLGLLILREVVDLFADHSKSDSAAGLDYRVLLSLHHLAVYWIKCHSFHCLSFSEFVSQVALISAGVAAFAPAYSQGREPCVVYNSFLGENRAQHT